MLPGPARCSSLRAYGKYARTTTRLTRTHLAIGSALGGEAGARLAKKIGVPTSPDTLLRRVKQSGPRTSGSPRLVGIDDWAWRKGQRYGTIVVDLETSEIIDLLIIVEAVPRRRMARRLYLLVQKGLRAKDGQGGAEYRNIP